MVVGILWDNVNWIDSVGRLTKDPNILWFISYPTKPIEKCHPVALMDSSNKIKTNSYHWVS